MSTVESDTEQDIGILANNYMFVNGLRSALSKTETNVSAVVKSMRIVIAQHCWQQWIDPDGRVVKHNAADFRSFVESPWPKGCGVSISVVLRSIEKTDVWEPFQDLVRGTPGAPPNNLRNPSGANQHSERSNRDIVTVRPDSDAEPSIIPLSPDMRRERDHTREAATGNSVSYGLRRLRKNRPDLYEQVKVGDLTCHAAMVKAGFSKPSITLLLDPLAASRLLIKHFSEADLTILIRELTNWSEGGQS